MKYLAIPLALVTTACVFDRARDRPTRLRVGASTRSLGASAMPGSDATLRQVSPPQEPALTDARTAGGQFTQRFLGVMYAGGEIEVGRMNLPRSQLSGGYSILGMEHAFGRGAIGVELAAGWRGLRVGTTENEEHYLVAEPRIRGEVWIAERFTLGAVLGTTFGQPGASMLGIQLGVHSSMFGR